MSRTEKDSFPDLSLLDPMNINQEKQIRQALDANKIEAIQNGINQPQSARLSHLLDDNIKIFRASLSSGPLATVPPMTIDLMANARPVRARLRNFSQEQKTF